MSRTNQTLFLVERTVYRTNNWVRMKKLSGLLREASQADPFVQGTFVLPIFARGEGGAPVRAFLDRGSAESLAEQYERETWRKINPFYYGDSLAEWTSFDHGRLCDWILDMGLDPPKGKRVGPQTWRKWYDEMREQMHDLHLAKMREGLDRVRFYRVAVLTPDETRVEDVVYRSV